MKRVLTLVALLLACACVSAQTYGRYQNCQLQTQFGQAVAGASVYFLTQPANTVTLTPLASVYSSSTGGAITNPVTTNGQGQCTAYLTPGVYTVVYTSPITGNVILTDQNISIGGGGGGSSGTVNSGATNQVATYSSTGTVVGGSGSLNISPLSTEAEFYGANPSASAAVNTAAINNALAVDGSVTLLTPGTYQINAPAVLAQGGNTTFTTGPGVHFVQTNGSDGNVLVNWAYAHRGDLVTAPTYASGVSGCATGTQTVTFATSAGTIAALGSVTIAGGVPTGAITITNPAAWYQTVPTSGTISTCTGTASFSGGAISGAATAVTLTWSAGLTMSVAWPSHGFSVGQYVALFGSSPSMFNGPFKILSVTDANDFVVTLLRLPSSTPTGSAVGLLMDQNIVVNGGSWNWNGSNQTATGNNQVAMIFGLAENLTVENVNCSYTTKFCFEFAFDRDYIVKNLGAEPYTYSDLVKVYGPDFHGVVDGLHGQNGDDVLTLSPKEGAAYPTYLWTYGDIQGTDISNVSVENSGSGNEVGLIGSDTEYLGGTRIKNVGGRTHGNGVLETCDYTPCYIDDVSGYNIFTATDYNYDVTLWPDFYYAPGGSTMNLGTTYFHQVNYGGTGENYENTNTVPLVYIQAGTVAPSLTFDAINLNTTNIGSGTDVFKIFGSSTQTTAFNLTIENSSFVGSSNSKLLEAEQYTAPNILLNNVYNNNAGSFITMDAGVTNTPNIAILNSNITANSGVGCSINCNVYLQNNSLNSMSGGVLRATGTINMNYAGGSNTYSGSTFQVAVSGSPTFAQSADAYIPTSIFSAGGNLVANPGFESGSAGSPSSWTLFTNAGATCAFTWDTSDPQAGVYSEKMANSVTSGYCNMDSATLSMTTGNPYSVSFWARGNVGGEVIRAQVTNSASTITYCPQESYVLTTSWQQFSRSCSSGATGSTAVLLLSTPTGIAETLWVDTTDVSPFTTVSQVGIAAQLGVTGNGSEACTGVGNYVSGDVITADANGNCIDSGTALSSLTTSVPSSILTGEQPTGIIAGTYTSGGTITGSTSETCDLSFTNGGTATVPLTGSNTIASGTALTITAAGSSTYVAEVTSATLSSGTATCSGTATVVGDVGIEGTGSTVVVSNNSVTVPALAAGQCISYTSYWQRGSPYVGVQTGQWYLPDASLAVTTANGTSTTSTLLSASKITICNNPGVTNAQTIYASPAWITNTPLPPWPVQTSSLDFTATHVLDWRANFAVGDYYVPMGVVQSTGP